METKAASAVLVLNLAAVGVLAAIPVELLFDLAPAVPVPTSAVAGWAMATAPTAVAVGALVGGRLGIVWAAGSTAAQLVLVANVLLGLVLVAAAPSMYRDRRTDLLPFSAVGLLVCMTNSVYFGVRAARLAPTERGEA